MHFKEVQVKSWLKFVTSSNGKITVQKQQRKQMVKIECANRRNSFKNKIMCWRSVCRIKK